MPTLVVIGAGPLGAAVVHQTAGASLATRIVLVDAAADVARGLALDIRQAGAIAGSSAAVEGTGDSSAVVGASLVIVADRFGAAGEWRGDDGLRLIDNVRALNPRALIVCAGAQQGDLVETMVRERDADPRWIAGSAPEALRGAMTALVGLETGAAPADVSLAVVGRPPKDLFVPWEGASVGGSRAADVLTPPVIGRLDRQVPYLWPPGPLTLASAATRVARLALTRASGWVSLFLVPPPEHDMRVRGVAVPATVGSAGVRPLWPVLAPRDRVRLDSTLG